MPRPKSSNTFQVSLLIPDEARALADELAKRMAPEGMAPFTRTDVLRAALLRGLDALDAEHPAPKHPRKR